MWNWNELNWSNSSVYLTSEETCAVYRFFPIKTTCQMNWSWPRKIELRARRAQCLQVLSSVWWSYYICVLAALKWRDLNLHPYRPNSLPLPIFFRTFDAFPAWTEVANWPQHHEVLLQPSWQPQTLLHGVSPRLKTIYLHPVYRGALHHVHMHSIGRHWSDHQDDCACLHLQSSRDICSGAPQKF